MDGGCCGEYRLEENDSYNINWSDKTRIVQNLYIRFRFEHGTLTKIRLVMAGCHINAGGIAFTWLTGVQPEDSISFLGHLATQSSDRSRVTDEALLSIGYHAVPAATRSLTQIASSATPLHTREQAAFWLGALRGLEGFLALKSLETTTTDTALREKFPFDFSQNSDPAAQDELLHMAKFDADSRIRERALFWLAQKAGKKASAAITDTIENDPQTEVKKKAVFALS